MVNRRRLRFSGMPREEKPSKRQEKSAAVRSMRTRIWVKLRKIRESRNRDIKIVNGSVIESFQLDGGNGRVVYNGTEPRFWGVVFYFTIAVLVVAGVVPLIVFLRRRAMREGKSTKGVLSQLAEKKELPGETPEEARESVEDILSKL